jgi:Sulfotransferase family
MSEPPREAPARPQVIYVMGAGRSGSTIVGVTLGNCENVFYAGELDAWLARSGEPQLGGAERIAFWSAVRDRVNGASELYGREPQQALERSLALFRVNKWRARRRLRRPYRRVAEDLYRAITALTEGKLIVDTSHYPLRARELQALSGLDLYLLYLVRDPESVVASFNRRDVSQYMKSTLTTNVYLWLTNLLSVLVFLRQPRDRRIFVRYEDFVANPEQTLREVLGRAGAPLSMPDLTSLTTGIPFQGNRLIRSDVVTLKAEASVPERSRITAFIQLPWRLVLSRLQRLSRRASPSSELRA